VVPEMDRKVMKKGAPNKKISEEKDGSFLSLLSPVEVSCFNV